MSPFSALSRRDTYYYGLFGNVSQADADYADMVMDDLLQTGNMTVVASILFSKRPLRHATRVR